MTYATLVAAVWSPVVVVVQQRVGRGVEFYC